MESIGMNEEIKRLQKEYDIDEDVAEQAPSFA